MIDLHWAVYVVSLVGMIGTGASIAWPIAVWRTNRQRDKEIDDSHQRELESRQVTIAERAQASGSTVSVGMLTIGQLPARQSHLVDDPDDAGPA